MHTSGNSVRALGAILALLAVTAVEVVAAQEPPGTYPEVHDPPSTDKPAQGSPDEGTPDIENMAPGLFPPEGDLGPGRVPPMEPEQGRRDPDVADPTRPPGDLPRDGAGPPGGGRPQPRPGDVGPPLGRIEAWLMTPEPARLLVSSPDGGLQLCDLHTGVCVWEGKEPESGRPVCATHLRNGWLWALTASGEGISLCAEGCGPSYEPGQAPPLPTAELQLLPEGSTKTCGNAADGTSFWLGTRSLQRWVADRSDIASLPGAQDATTGAVLSSPGALWFVRDGRLWTRAWRGEGSATFRDVGSAGPDAAFWPAACEGRHRTLDRLLYVAPATRGLVSGLRAGVWGLGGCGLVPVSLFDLPTGRTEPILWPDELLNDPAWPGTEPVQGVIAESLFVHVLLKPPGAPSRVVWTANVRSNASFAPLQRELPMAEVTGLVTADGRAFALGDGVVSIGTQRRVGLMDGESKPLGLPRLGVSHHDAEGDWEAVVTTWPAGLWLWSPSRPRPMHLQVAAGGRPDRIEELKFSTMPDGALALAYRIGSAWYLHPTAAGGEPRAADGVPEAAPQVEPSSPDESVAGEAAESGDGQAGTIVVMLGVIVLLGGVWWLARRR